MLKKYAEAAGYADITPESIVGYDLFVYNRQSPSVWGACGEFMSSPKLDDLQCAFSSMCGFLESAGSDSVPVHAVFDNEEIGSMTKQGAASPFLKDTLERIANSLELPRQEYLNKLSRSFMLSADNAHAFHPNYPDKCDPVNKAVMGGGVVLKFSGNQKYTTDGASAAVFHALCRRAQIPVQDFSNRSDVPGGSTLGNISSTKVPVLSVDIGLAQLAMHSACETAGTEDLAYLIKFSSYFYQGL
jgi:aspartyl aminopeptidase